MRNSAQKNSMTVLLIILILVLSLTVLAKTQFINIGTGGTAGTYYPLGGAIAEILNKNVKDINTTAVSTGASVANVNMLKEDSIQIGFIQNDVSYYALKGIEMFQGKTYTELRALCTLYPETIQIITLKGKGINTVNDLKGKRIAVGAAGSGVEVNARQILETIGLFKNGKYIDCTPQYLSFAEAANGLRDGNTDVAFLTAGLPTAAVRDIASQKDIFVLPIPNAIADKLIAQYPFYTKTVIAKDTYPKMTENVSTLSVKAMLVVTSAMNAELAYNIVKAIYSNLDRLINAHAMGKLITKETALEGISIPLHPGAEKFFKNK